MEYLSRREEKLTAEQIKDAILMQSLKAKGWFVQNQVAIFEEWKEQVSFFFAWLAKKNLLPPDFSSLQEIKTAIVEAGLRPTIPPTCPEKPASLIRQCWSHEPEKRPTMAHILSVLKEFWSELEP